MSSRLRIKYPTARSTHARSLGWATSILASSNLCHRPFSYAREVLAPAIRHEQIGFLADENNRDVAFFIWATLHEFTLKEMSQKKSFPTYESDWSELGALTLIDLVTTQKLTRHHVANIYMGMTKKRTAVAGDFLRLKENFSFKKISLKAFL
jgi:hemolysin-activating ACP:hemolysin acyltransferase